MVSCSGRESSVAWISGAWNSIYGNGESAQRADGRAGRMGAWHDTAISAGRRDDAAAVGDHDHHIAALRRDAESFEMNFARRGPLQSPQIGERLSIAGRLAKLGCFRRGCPVFRG